MFRIDDGHKALEDLARTYGQLDLADANEAETRFHVIDEVLARVLGWEKDDIEVEDRVVDEHKTTYADYVLRTASTRLVVEAKRVGVAFELPPTRRLLKLGGVLAEGKIGAAIRQARGYCINLSIPFAAVTNGSSWIVFPAVRTDGIPFEQGEAHVFRDLEAVRERFVEFWELLSRERVMDGNLEHVLIGRLRTNSPNRSIRQLLPEPGYRLGRNAVYEQIEPAIAAALSDEALLEDSEALEACYVKTSERVKFDTRLRMHLADPRPPLGRVSTRVRHRKHSGSLDRLVGSRPPKERRFIVVLGPVGAGKTTFLEYTRRVSAADHVDRDVLWLAIDFKKATVGDEPRVFLYNEILQCIEEDESFGLGDWEKGIKPAYRKRIDILRRGALQPIARQDPDRFEREIGNMILAERKSVEPYVEIIMEWASHKWGTYLVIDNVDQIEDAGVQARIFSEAQALARRVSCNVIMAMREATYLAHRSSPTFDAFQFDVMYVDPPNILPVLSNRFTYAQRVLRGHRAEFATESGVRLAVPDLGVFFEIVSQSLLAGDAGFMFESLAGGDIRRGLALVREFLGSGHTNADRALASYLASGAYRFPTHEILRGAVLGQYRYFDDSVSLLPNIFDAKLATKGLQLLRLRIVNHLVAEASGGETDGVLLGDLLQVLGRMGVASADAESCLRDLCQRRLLQTHDGMGLADGSRLRPTRMAGYTLRVLCTMFAYLEFCSLDTIIHDDDVWGELRDVTFDIDGRSHLDRMAGRIDRLRKFLAYLRQADERWVVDAKRRSLTGSWSEEVVQSLIMPGAEVELTRAWTSAQNNARANRLPPKSIVVNDKWIEGVFKSVWPAKDYAFIRDQHGVEWFTHRTDFEDEDDWSLRARDRGCRFRPGEFKGKPRAVNVRILTTDSDRNRRE